VATLANLPWLFKDPRERRKRKQARKGRQVVPPPVMPALQQGGVIARVRRLATKSFQHPGDISVRRALACYNIMHNHASEGDWDVIDAWVDAQGLEQVLDDIERVLAMNGVGAPARARERAWWAREIGKPGAN